MRAESTGKTKQERERAARETMIESKGENRKRDG